MSRYKHVYIAETIGSVSPKNPKTDSFSKHKLNISSVQALP